MAKLWQCEQLPLAVLYVSLACVRPELTCDADITETGPHHGMVQPHGAAGCPEFPSHCGLVSIRVTLAKQTST